jgi:hypothetical protein
VGSCGHGARSSKIEVRDRKKLEQKNKKVVGQVEGCDGGSIHGDDYSWSLQIDCHLGLRLDLRPSCSLFSLCGKVAMIAYSERSMMDGGHGG